MGTILLVLALVFIGGALGTLVLATGLGAGQPTGVARSLDLIERTIDKNEVGKSDLPAMERLVAPMLNQTRALAQRLSPTGANDRIVRRLNLAGNPGSWTVERVMGAKGIGLLVGAVLGFLLGGQLSIRGLVICAAAAAAGFFLPDLLLMNTGQKRQEELQRGLADALDMLTVCVEAGQGFDAALLQVARSTTGPISGEFARVLSEIQIGKTRGAAFSSLAARTTVSEAKTFVSALVQADRLGLPIGNVLREQSNQMRLVRRQRAEEKAMKVPVKILFPMLLFIFPALFIVIIGPGAIRIADTFGNM
ncbi:MULTISPECIES: type II secretion system F family protein [unclassified Phycicoccus]|uniref:type II secretion system F family protein n=1 Tax=unclassified Phycicoccus TaxID=2637926 RepID=UPI0007031178|nr:MULTISPECIES: type II secretion system F family protein [unclassified Phycicoccus]KRF24187.1 secretion system protein TadC [Phycicoccus sp. Soil803]KRF27153.1 secretion system protein TadC [Phycicoccus sp. Soil802]